MTAELGERGLQLRSESGLFHDASTGTFYYAVASSADRADKRHGSTELAFDADSGALRHFSSPLNEKAGDVVTRWMTDLHVAAIWGRPYALFVTLLGLAVAGLSMTGILIWLKKRSARLLARRKRQTKPEYAMAAAQAAE